MAKRNRFRNGEAVKYQANSYDGENHAEESGGMGKRHGDGGGIGGRRVANGVWRIRAWRRRMAIIGAIGIEKS